MNKYRVAALANQDVQRTYILTINDLSLFWANFERLKKDATNDAQKHWVFLDQAGFLGDDYA
jgi:hypothetical protein